MLRTQRRRRMIVSRLEDRLAPAGLVSLPYDTGRIAEPLRVLFAEYSAHHGQFTPSNQWLAVDPAGQRVSVRLTADVDQLLPQLSGLDFHVSGAYAKYSLIDGDLPISNVMKLDALSGFAQALPVWKFTTDVGLTTSQAVDVHETLRANFAATPYTGAGVKVGVLSDSYNVKGNAQFDITNKDLPASGVINYQEGAGKDEGRAMLQLIHDIAPNAQLAFAAASADESLYAGRINTLATTFGAQVIVDDVPVPEEPMFQDGLVSQMVATITATNKVLYFASAGNRALQAYETTNFGGAGDSAGLYIGVFHDFDPGVGVDTRQLITVPAKGSFNLNLQWDDPFYNPAGVNTDLDIRLLQPGTTISFGTGGVTTNIGSSSPYEYLSYENTTNAAQQFEIMIERRTGTANPGRLRYVNFGSDVVTGSEFATNSPTINPHSGSTNVIAVAAAPFYDHHTPEYFTSVGPAMRLFSPDGTVTYSSPDIRNKPDFTAVDDVNTNFFVSGNDPDNDGYPNFPGTSAAAPNAAAIAALMFEKYPGSSASYIRSQMAMTTTDIGIGGNDFVTGFGLVNAWDALMGPAVPAKINFTDHFVDGSLGTMWETNTSGRERIRVSDALLLDSFYSKAGNSLAEAILHVNALAPNVTMSFIGINFDDEGQSLPASFTGSVNADGVSFSVDGTTWFRLMNGSDIVNNFYYFDLSAEAAKHGVTLSSDTRIKFQQYDNSPINNAPNESDGLLFDAVQILSSFAPNKFWDGGGLSTSWTNSENWNDNIVPTTTDKVSIDAGYTVTVNAASFAGSVYSNSPITLTSGSLTISQLFQANELVTLNGGTLDLLSSAVAKTQTIKMDSGVIQGDAHLTVSKTFDWNGGYLYGTTADAKVIIPPGANLNVATSGTHYLGYSSTTGRIIENFGTATWSDNGSISTAGPARWENRQGSTFVYSGTGGWAGPVPLNLDSCALNITSPNMTMNSPVNIFGPVDVTGVFRLNSSILTFSNGSSMVGNGNVQIIGNGTLLVPADLTATVDHLVLSGGGLITGDGLLNVGKTMVWNSGYMYSPTAEKGTLHIASIAVMTIGTLGTHYVGYSSDLGRKVINDGVVLWTGGPVSTTAGTWTNSASSTFDVRTSEVWFGTHRMINYGTVSRSNDPGPANINVPFDVADITVNVDAGELRLGGGGNWSKTTKINSGMLDLTGGTFTMANNTAVIGAGTLRVLGGTMNIPATAIVSWEHGREDSGTITGDGELLITDSFAWNGGYINSTTAKIGKLTVFPFATFTIDTGATHYLGYSSDPARTIDNFGVVTWAGSGTISTSANGQWNNLNSSSFTYSGTAGWNGSVPLNFTDCFVIVAVPSFTMSTPVNFAGTVNLTGLYQSTALTTLANNTKITGGGTLSCIGGNLENPGAASVVNFKLDGGSVVGDGTLTINNVMNWLNGYVYSTTPLTGKLVIPAAASLNISSDGTHYLGYSSGAGRILENSGQVTWSNNGTISTSAGARFDNLAGSKFTYTGAAGWSGTVPLNFTNCQVNITSPVLSMATPVNVTGAVDLTGVLRMAADVLTLQNGSSVVGTGTVKIDGGTLFLASGTTANVNNLELNTGLINGDGLLNVLQTMNWNSGYMYTPTLDKGTLHIASTATMTIGTLGTHYIGYSSDLGRKVVNDGTVIWTGGTVSTTAGTWTNNLGSLFDVRVSESWIGSHRIINNGDVRRSTVAGVATFAVPFDAADMKVEVTTGELNLSGGGSWSKFTYMTAGMLGLTGGNFNMAHNTAVTGAGTLKVAGGTVTIPAAAVVSWEHGRQDSGVITGDGELLITNSFVWNGGDMYSTTAKIGKLTVFPGATFTIDGPATHYLGYSSDQARAIDNFGAVTWTGSGPISTAGSGPWNNFSGSSFTYSGTAGWTGSVPLNFTDCNLIVTVPSFTMNTPVNFAGTVNLTGLYQSVNQTTLANNTKITGAGTMSCIAGTLDNPGAASIVSFKLDGGGAVVGDGTLTINSIMNWVNGYVYSTTPLTGKLVIPGGASLNISSDATHYLGYSSGPGRIVENSGQATWSNNGTISTSAGARFDNLVGSKFTYTGGGGWSGAVPLNFTNCQVNITSPALSMGTPVNFAGITNLTGTLRMVTSATTLANGAEIVGTGMLSIEGGNLEVPASGSVANLVVNSGVVTGVGALTIAGKMTWNGGYLLSPTPNTGKLIIPAAAKLDIATGNTHYLGYSSDPGRIIQNAGTINWTGGTVSTAGTGNLQNLAGGKLNLQVDDAWVGSVGIVNAGLMQRSVGAGTVTIQGPVTNSGTVDVLTGTLALTGGLTNFAGTTLTGGTYHMVGVLRFAGAKINTNAATIILDGPAAHIQNELGVDALNDFATNTGSFTLQNGAGLLLPATLTNSGQVTIGSGCLLATLTGDYVQTAGNTTVNGTLDPAGAIVMQGGTWNGGAKLAASVTNSGTIINPGNSPGILTINGDYTQTGTGTLQIELEGTTAGTLHDQLAVNGAVALDGPLLLSMNYAAKVGDSFVIIDNDGVDPITGTFSGLAENGTVIVGGATLQITYKGGTGNDAVLTVTKTSPPPTASIVIDDGSVQRSMIRSFVVTFSEAVTYPDGIAAAFQLVRTSPGSPTGPVTLAFAPSANSVTITFNDAVYASGAAKSLIDGRYTLTLNAAKIQGAGGLLDGNNDGTGGDDRVQLLHRLFGDADGNATVNGLDFLAFRLAFLGSTTTFDFDGSGQVTGTDFLQFRLRFLQSV